MINFKQGDLVQLKNDGDKKDIYSIGGAYKQSSDEYTYELLTLNGRYLEDDYTNSDLVKYDQFNMSIQAPIFKYGDSAPF